MNKKVLLLLTVGAGVVAVKSLLKTEKPMYYKAAKTIAKFVF